MKKAFHFLSRRQFGEQELRAKLSEREFNDAHIDQTMASLIQQGFIDDTQFAYTWIDHAVNRRKKSISFARRELTAKGVSGEDIQRGVVLANPDEDHIARDLFSQRMVRELQRVRGTRDNPATHTAIRRRVTAYMLRRGYTSALVSQLFFQWDERVRV